MDEEDKKGLAKLLKKSSDLRSTMFRTGQLVPNEKIKMMEDTEAHVSRRPTGTDGKLQLSHAPCSLCHRTRSLYSNYREQTIQDSRVDLRFQVCS